MMLCSGNITLSAPSVVLSSMTLDISRLQQPATITTSFTLCSCANGKLFLMPSSSTCSAVNLQYTVSPCP